MWVLSSSVLLGWALGGNDAANVFGPAVSSNVLKFRTAALLTAFFVIVGSLVGGHAGLETIGKLTGQTAMQAFMCMLSAGLVVVLMTFLKIPVSTSQAVIGSVIGAGLVGSGVHWQSLTKVVICWIGTPIGAALICYILHIVISKILSIIKPNIFQMDRLIRAGLLFCCMYGAYALGANNVANTTAVFVKANLISPTWALIIGSISIAFGVVTFSKNVVHTVGKSIVPLDSFSALVALQSSAITVHFYAIVGVPVSTSQAIIGAVLGIGLIKGLYTINFKSLVKIFAGWICTPIFSILLAMAMISLFLCNWSA